MNIKERLEAALGHCDKLRKELLFSHGWISKELINEQWVRDLEKDEMKKERVSAFCARFGKFFCSGTCRHFKHPLRANG